MTLTASDRTGQPITFRWHPSARAFDAGAPGADAGPLAHLRQALEAGRPFRAGPDGVDIGGSDIPSGHFQCRTSGTTGAPKVIERTAASWIASFDHNARLFDLGPGTSVAALGGPGHSLSLYAAIEAAYLGADFHLLAGLGPRAQAAEMAAAGIDILYATPAQLSLLIRAHPPLPALRHILCGGGSLPAALRTSLTRLCPNAAIAVFYGASETSFVTLSDADTPEGSVGRAYGGARIEIRDEQGQQTDGTGTVWVASPYLFARYASGASAETRREGDFLTVGEMGWLDASGALFLTGRRDRMLRIAEQSVHPETVEALILGDAGVAQACVLPRPDAARGQVLVAVIAGGADAALTERLDSACRAAFGPLIAPRRYHFLPDFPLREAGKPDLARIARWLDAQP